MVVMDGMAGLDPYQPLTTFRGEQEVSLLVVPDCKVPEIEVDRASADADGALSVAGTFLAATGGPALDPASVRVTVDGVPTAGAKVSADSATGALSIAAKGLAMGKHTIAVSAAGAGGDAAPDARAAVWVQPAAETWEDAVLYQIVTDRFRGDGGSALAPPPTPGRARGWHARRHHGRDRARDLLIARGDGALDLAALHRTPPASSTTSMGTRRRGTTATGRSRNRRSSRASAGRPQWRRSSPPPTPMACGCSSISSPTTSSTRTRATSRTRTMAGSTTAPTRAPAARRGATGGRTSRRAGSRPTCPAPTSRTTRPCTRRWATRSSG